jgi:hypothetical protein
VGNDPITRIDSLGEASLATIPNLSIIKWALLKPCGQIGRRAALPNSAGPLSPIIDILSTLGFPHYFVQLEPDRILDHGGDPDSDTHWTVIKTPIMIPRCVDCDAFKKCIIGAWPPSDSYGLCSNNCKKGAVDAISKCGGVIGFSGILADLNPFGGTFADFQLRLFLP